MKKRIVGASLALAYLTAGVLPAFFIGAAPFVLAGCERESDLEEAGEEIGDELEDAGDEIEDEVD